MKNRFVLLTLILGLMFTAINAGRATSSTAPTSPLRARASLKITFKPVLITETVADGFEEDGVSYSPAVRMVTGLKVASVEVE